VLQLASAGPGYVFTENSLSDVSSGHAARLVILIVCLFFCCLGYWTKSTVLWRQTSFAVNELAHYM